MFSNVLLKHIYCNNKSNYLCSGYKKENNVLFTKSFQGPRIHLVKHKEVQSPHLDKCKESVENYSEFSSFEEEKNKTSILSEFSDSTYTTWSSTNPCTRSCTEPETMISTNPCTRSCTEPETMISTNPCTRSCTETETMISTNPCTQSCTEPDTMSSTEPGTMNISAQNSKSKSLRRSKFKLLRTARLSWKLKPKFTFGKLKNPKE